MSAVSYKTWWIFCSKKGEFWSVCIARSKHSQIRQLVCVERDLTKGIAKAKQLIDSKG